MIGLGIYTKITLFIDVVAAATCSPLAFTLPALFHYKLAGKRKSDMLIVVVTIALSIFMIGEAIYELIESFI